MQDFYQSCYVEAGIWLVCNGDHAFDLSKCIPVFCKVHTVKATLDRFLKYWCYNYEWTGTPCRHIALAYDGISLSSWYWTLSWRLVHWMVGQLQNVCIWYARWWQLLHWFSFAKYSEAKHSRSTIKNCNTWIFWLQMKVHHLQSISWDTMLELFRKWYCPGTE